MVSPDHSCLFEVTAKSSMFCQGCAKMTSRIGGSVGGGNWKYAHGTAHYGRNFSVKWLKVPFLFILMVLIYVRHFFSPKGFLGSKSSYAVNDDKTLGPDKASVYPIK